MTLDRIPKQLGAGETIHVYKDGQPGPGGTVGNHKIDIRKSNRHYSVQSLKTLKTKITGDKLTDQYGNTIDKLRQSYDIERAPASEIKENKRKSFKEYISEDVKNAGSGGEQMEVAIVTAFNGQAYNGPFAQVGKRIATILKNEYSLQGSASSLGKDQNVSAEWSQFWAPESVPGSTKTPKTDIKIGNKKVSVKMGAAQLMSGGQNESKATFWAACQGLKNGPHHQIAEEVAQLFQGLVGSSVAATGVEAALKSGKDQKLNEAEIAHKKLMAQLNVMFDQSPEFAYAFTYEATCGDIKFARGEAAADTILAVTKDGQKIFLHPTSDKTYMKKIADQLRIQVRFKSTSVKKKVDGESVKTGEYRYWSVVSLIVNKLTESLEHVYDNLLIEDIQYHKHNLMESMSNASRQAHQLGMKYMGWGQWGDGNYIRYHSAPDGSKLVPVQNHYHKDNRQMVHAQAAQHLKHVTGGFVDKAKNVIKNVVDKVKQKIMEYIRKVIAWISESFKNLLDFLGFAPSVSFNNEPSWVI